MKGGIVMDINSNMAQQLASIQHALTMAVMDKAVNQGAGAVEMLQEMAPQQPASHPYKGQVIDVQV